MVRPGDLKLANQIDRNLMVFDDTSRKLPGIQGSGRRENFIAQVIESIRRIEYVYEIKGRDVSNRRADPNDEFFDPLKAAIYYQRHDQVDEACWMIFFFVHFGRHQRGGWRYARDVYGRLGDPTDRWDWETTSADPADFRTWLNAHQSKIKDPQKPGGFGNHRKYQSLDACSDVGTGAAIETYVRWVNPPRTHEELVDQAFQGASQSPRKTFRALYRSMSQVASFGRTARFDYLTMLGKLGLAPIEPDSTYMHSSTGPLTGARLLFGVEETPSKLDRWLVELDAELGIGMQVLEDALCNWQKNPDKFVPFRG